MNGIPIPFSSLPQTAQNFGQVERAQGLAGLRGDASAAIQAAGRAVTTDARGFVVQAQALGAVGQAVTGEADALMALRIKANEARDIRIEHEASLAMEMAQDEIAQKIREEPDESKWQSIAETHTAALEKSLLTPDLSPNAREAVGLRFSMWRKRTGAAAGISSAQRSFERAGEAVQASMIRAVDAGDFATAQKLGQDFVAAGYQGEDWLARQEVAMKERATLLSKKAAADAVDAAQNAVIETVDSLGPEVTLRMIENGDIAAGVDAADRERLRNVAQSVSRDRTMDLTGEIFDRIATGELQHPEQVDVIDSVFLTDADRAKVKEVLLKQQDTAEKARLAEPEVQFAIYGGLLARANAWQKDQPTAEREYFDIHSATAMLPENLRGEITGPLARKRTGAAPNPDAILSDYVTDRLSRLYDRGALGQWKKEGISPTTFKMETVVDEKMQDSASRILSKTHRAMRTWLNANPNATEDAADGQMQKIMSGYIDTDQAAQLLDQMKEPSAALFPPDLGASSPAGTPVSASGKVTKYGYSADPRADALSAQAIGAFSGQEAEDAAKAGSDHPNLLKPGDLAVSPDVEEQLRAAGVEPGDLIRVKLADGTTRATRWMDRTATDAQAKKLGLAPLRGRWDFFTPSGKEPHDGAAVVGFEPIRKPK